MDDVRVGRIIRALRRRRGWRQTDLAKAAKVSQSVVSRAERGHSSTLSAAAVRRIANALDARLEWTISWRGGELDRLLDELHAALGTATVSALGRFGWTRVVPELTFMRFGERGSIDLVALDEERKAAVIIELKSELTSYEEMQRRLDVKTRTAAALIEDRFGWRPRHLAVVLVLAETRTNRDRVKRVAPLLKAALPAGTVEVRRWLRDPKGRLAGVWFLPISRQRTSNRRTGGSHRVRKPRAA
ncbi:MAG: helix-turn-helix transcriptional regulator [Candidatus Limnocylindrales bacterium]